MSNDKNKYLEDCHELKSKKNVIKIEINNQIQSFKNKQREYYKHFLVTNPSKDSIKVKKRSQNNELAEYILIEKTKLVDISLQIKNCKKNYIAKMDHNWKENHISKVSKVAPIKKQTKLTLINTKFDKKISDKENKTLNKINELKNKSAKLQKEIKDSQIRFIDEYKNETDYYQAEYLTIQNWKYVEAHKVKIRRYKSQIRNLQDYSDLTFKQLNEQKANKIAKLEHKHHAKLDFNKPFSKLFWVNQIMGSVNRGATKFDQQRHIYSIKMGLIYVMPLTLIAAFWILMNNVILSTSDVGFLKLIGVGESQGLTNFKAIGALISNITLGIMGVVLSFTIAGVLGNRQGINTFEAGVVGMVIFFAFLPSWTGKIDNVDQAVIKFGDLGSNSMFLAIFTSLIGIELYHFLTKQKYLKIKMPAQIPTAVARSFNVLIPFFLTTFIFGCISFSLLHFANKNLPEIITLIISKPLSVGIESIGGVVVIRLITDILWSIGIHGENMVGPIVSPIYLQHLAENAELVAKGLDPKWIVTSTFMDSYIMMNSSLMIIISIFLFSKRKDHLAIIAVASIPAIFNIREPIMFGLPLILNPLLVIPFIFGSLLMAIIGYLVIYWHWATALYVMTPWTTPPFVGPWLASGGDYRNLLLAFGLAGLGITIYSPFVVLLNKQAIAFSPDLVVTRFNFRSNNQMHKAEALEYLNELQEKEMIYKKDIKNSPLKKGDM